MWAGMDLNHRRLTPADLQSAAIDHSATDPTIKTRAIGGIRTPDPLITNQLLWPTELQWLHLLYKKALLTIASQFKIIFNNKKQFFLI